ncbi:hypothetical protein [Sphingomonas hengshuiensis]|uniref:Uncharacterized protein n=1 Tax=Sphingomonas hengshuiensis TaxID=1609977 RepID=A0A7U4J9U6_9SPHN|nr:hypothetical protein [Sphingomonas hengshuiensis]AJP72915.1 hypothetical protein TS85_15645 [Sphingomonas hengshuiensis]
MGANAKYETLSDIVRKGLNLGVQCGCGNVAVIDAARMERWYMCHMWDKRLHMLRDHLYCLRCGGRPREIRLRPSGQVPTAPNRFPVTEEQWVRVIRGLRS